MSNVLIGEFNFDNSNWSKVSQLGKDFVSKLLTYDPEKRISAEHALYE